VAFVRSTGGGLIDRYVFDNNRHAITSDGKTAAAISPTATSSRERRRQKQRAGRSRLTLERLAPNQCGPYPC
jgi:hypothetical protein